MHQAYASVINVTKSGIMTALDIGIRLKRPCTAKGLHKGIMAMHRAKRSFFVRPCLDGFSILGIVLHHLGGNTTDIVNIPYWILTQLH